MLKRLLPLLAFLYTPALRAQDPITAIIKQAITKVIVAADLKIQRLQNKTLVLQQAQKTLENTLSKFRLEEITDWMGKAKALYEHYYTELQEVKASVRTFYRVREVLQSARRLVTAYHRAVALIEAEKGFTASERTYMRTVYGGILQKAGDLVETLGQLVQSFTSSMTDAQRLDRIGEAAESLRRIAADLYRFTAQNGTFALQRSHSREENQRIKQLYGL